LPFSPRRVKSQIMPDMKQLAPGEWLLLRNVRLSALEDSPRAFLSTYEEESAYSKDRWQAEFARGEWSIGLVKDNPISLLGATSEPDTPTHQRYLEYLWVSPEHRRSGIGRTMLTSVIACLRTVGVRSVFLWVLDGNDAARSFYRSVGFLSTNHRQSLPAHPARGEERMRLDLA
jgi:ribosomal protein S18 acetylase RimI-like enzyme